MHGHPTAHLSVCVLLTLSLGTLPNDSASLPCHRVQGERMRGRRTQAREGMNYTSPPLPSLAHAYMLVHTLAINIPPACEVTEIQTVPPGVGSINGSQGGTKYGACVCVCVCVCACSPLCCQGGTNIAHTGAKLTLG